MDIKGLLEKKFLEIDKQSDTKKIRSARDEIVNMFVEGINTSRKGTKWKMVAPRTIAVLINSHPTLSKSVSECWYLYSECKRVGNWSKFWWTVNYKEKPPVDLF